LSQIKTLCLHFEKDVLEMMTLLWDSVRIAITEMLKNWQALRKICENSFEVIEASLEFEKTES
jgi:hypothetical protein